MDDYIRELIDREIKNLKENLNHKIDCNKEEMDMIRKGLASDIQHKYLDNKERIDKEEILRKEEIKNIKGTIEHKWDLNKWLISGAFGSMAIMAGAFFWLILSIESSLLVELCQQGQMLSDNSYFLINDLLLMINDIREANDTHFIERFQRIVIPNCNVASASS